jgi:hypothetical protein
MVETLRIRRLEEELELLRWRLYQSVNGVPSRLTDSQVLPLSMRLDDLIVEVQRAKLRLHQ